MAYSRKQSTGQTGGSALGATIALRFAASPRSTARWTLGIRGDPRTLDWLEPSYALGYEVITEERYDDLGPEGTVALVRERIGDEPAYITFDLVCLGPTVAPGVANLEAGIEGLFMRDFVPMLQGLRGANVIGGGQIAVRWS